MSAKNWNLILVIVLLNFLISTVYYNWFDDDFVAIQKEFVPSAIEEMSCDGEMEFSVCEGGVLTKRDNYLKSHHVISFIDWKITGTVIYISTFQFYFKYWL